MRNTLTMLPSFQYPSLTHSCLSLLRLALFTVGIFCTLPTGGQDNPPPVIRELFVPEHDLQAILEAGNSRVFLPRVEYETLLAEAEKVAPAHAPHSVVLLESNYDARIEHERVTVVGRLTFDVTEPGLHRVPLPIKHLGVLSAKLDAKPARLANVASEVVLFVEGVGRQELVIELLGRVTVEPLQQSWKYQLPAAPVGLLRVEVPGYVERKGGPDLVRQSTDESNQNTTIHVALTNAPAELILSRNHRMRQDQLVLASHGVQVAEIATTYERTHMTASIEVLHGVTDLLEFTVPADFEVLTVRTPLLASWSVDRSTVPARLSVKLQDQVSGTIVIQTSAERAGPRPDDWSLSTLEPLHTAHSVALVGILLEPRLELTQLSAPDAIPLDVGTIVDVLPPGILQADATQPTLQPAAAYYVSRTATSIAAQFRQQPNKLLVQRSVMMAVGDQGIRADGTIELSPQGEAVREFQIAVDTGWRITQLVTESGQQIPINTQGDANGVTRVRVVPPQAIPAGNRYRIQYHAELVPPNWLGLWPTFDLQVPKFAILESSQESGAVAIRGEGDFDVLAGDTTNVVPLDAARKAEYQLSNTDFALAYTYEGNDWQIGFQTQRREPRMTAEHYSFFAIEPGEMTTRYELRYEVNVARTEIVRFRLPQTTPTELEITGFDGTGVKEYRHTVVNTWREWTVTLDRPMQGMVSLLVRFEQRASGMVTGETATTTALPVIEAMDVAYQSGAVAVEANNELAVSLNTTARRIDIGEFVDAHYQPGRRLLGSFGFVGAPPTVEATITRPALYTLPGAIVQRAELVTSISEQGLAQTAARYQLVAKFPFVMIELPANSTLWSVQVDGRPAKPQRDGERLLISFPPRQPSESAPPGLHDLQFVWETPTRQLFLWGSVQLQGPTLLARLEKNADPIVLPVSDIQWQVALPSGYHLIRHSGTVSPVEPLAFRADSGFESRAIGRLARAIPGPSALAPMARTTAIGPEGKFAGGAADSGVTDHEGRRGYRLNEMNGPQQPPQPQATFSAPDAAADAVLGAAEDTADSADYFADMPQSTVDELSSAARNIAPNMSVPQTAQPPAPPQQQPSGPVADGVTPAKRLNFWVLEGMRSLPIDIAINHPAMTFTSLGGEPHADLQLINERRWELLSWASASIIAAIGFMASGKSKRTPWYFLIGVIAVGSVLPMVMGWNSLMSRPWDYMVYMSIAMLVASVCLRLIRYWWLPRIPASVGAAALTAIFIGCLPNWGSAQENEVKLGPLSIRLDSPLGPTVIPEDAVIIPYDPNLGWQHIHHDSVIVSYSVYERLWNRAHPAEPLHVSPSAAGYATIEAQWDTEVTQAELLELRGNLLINVFQQESLWVPFRLEGGMIAEVLVDDKPARIRTVAPPTTDPTVSTDTPASQSQAATPARPNSLVVWIHLPGKGEHQLQWKVIFPVTRTAGWQVVQGTLPSAVVAPLRIMVPEADTEVRLPGLQDRTLHLTTNNRETVRTALDSDGTFSLHWRPKTSEGLIDRGLSVVTQALLDIQEDRLRLLWQLDYQFPQGSREELSFRLPEGYAVDRILGDNIRGWSQQENMVRILLLQPARDGQRLTVHLSQPVDTARSGETFNTTYPSLQVPGAMLHRGRIGIRRSPWIELQASNANGLVRADFEFSQVTGADQVETPFGIQPFQAYAFHDSTFSLQLSGTWAAVRYDAIIQSLVRVSDTQQLLESRITLTPNGRPVYHVAAQLPRDFQLRDVVAPGLHEWSVESTSDAQRVHIFLTRGETSPFGIVLRGKLPDIQLLAPHPLPVITVEKSEKQRTDVVVQTDPGWAVTFEELVGAVSIPLGKTYDWLREDQRAFARAAARAEQGTFSGIARLQPREPRVSCQSITNIRVTNRSFEETILLDFSILDAGIRAVDFQLPAYMRNATIEAPLVRSRSVTLSESGEQVLVHLELQDAVLGQYRVLVNHDHLVHNDTYGAPIPTILNGTTTRQFILLENVGRDEIVVTSQSRLAEVTPEQRDWGTLTGIMGGEPQQAYTVEPGPGAISLALQVQPRKEVETVEARILLAQTVFVIDENGTYRSQQTYYVDNRTEPYMDLQLPDGARVWTARVAGEPVKPFSVASGTTLSTGGTTVRIPLVKTAAGDRDYQVELKYAGRLEPLGIVSIVDFPFLKTLNIQVEESQVHLYVPESHDWANFRGSMRQLHSDAERTASFARYKARQIAQLRKFLDSTDEYSRLRAITRGRAIVQELTTLQSSGQYKELVPEVQQQLNSNQLTELFDQAEVTKPADGTQPIIEQLDNRGKLSGWYHSQNTQVSRDQLRGSVTNFAESDAERAKPNSGAESSDLKGGAIVSDEQRKWIDANGLKQSAETDGESPKRPRSSRVLLSDPTREQFKLSLGFTNEEAPRQQEQELPQAMNGAARRGGAEKSERRLQRYSEQLQRGDTFQSVDKAITAPVAEGQPSSNSAVSAGSVITREGQDYGAIAAGQTNEDRRELEGIELTTTGWSSLDVALPLRGIEYHFSTPRGDLQLRATAINHITTERGKRASIALAGLLILFSLTRLAGLRRRQLSPSR